MKILYLSFYYEPDLCAGSFRNTSLAKEISTLLKPDDLIHVVTTMPNRYSTYKEKTLPYQEEGNIIVERVVIPSHKSGLIDQVLAFKTYFFKAIQLSRKNEYDLIFASSSRLFTAFLGSVLSRYKRKPLYLDIRDIFVDTMQDVFKNKFLKYPLLFALKQIENITFSRANHINLISEGFKPYFKKYTNKKYSYFSNGIDSEFIKMPVSLNQPNNNFIITYAGNIGEGQGLHKIIPEAAKLLGAKYKFRIIGDGGKKKELQDQLRKEQISNVELIPPTSRKKLINYYAESHFLFLHLNDYKAFKKVLPSKIFEYGAFDKPIIAGVGGYAAQFIENNLTNYIIFSPGNAISFVQSLKEYAFEYKERIDFQKDFARSIINNKMAQSIIKINSYK